MKRPCLRLSWPDPLVGNRASDRIRTETGGAGGGVLRTAAALWRDTSGAIAIFVVLLVPVLIGFMGISVDVGLWYTARRALQNMADAAVLSGAGELANGGSSSVAETAAQAAADSNGFDASNGSVITINIPPSTGPSVGDSGAIEVLITRPMPLLFSALWVDTAFTAEVRAVANTEFVDEFCILGLADSGTAVEVTGKGTATLDCGIQVNSDDDEKGLNVAGTGSLDITSVTTVGGGVREGGTATLTTDSPPRRGPAVKDPYADLEIPKFSDCDLGGPLGPGDGYNTSDGDDFNPSTATTPGIFVFCGELKVDSDVTFKSGVYIIDSGNFKVTGGTLTGDDVTFIVTTSSKNMKDIGGFDIGGNSAVEFTAPTSDPLGNDPGYSGVLFYQDRRVTANPSKNNKINGGSDLDLEGALYFPGGDLDFRGGSELADGCVQLIGQKVTISGDTGVQGNCDAAGTRSIGRLRAKLVE